MKKTTKQKIKLQIQKKIQTLPFNIFWYEFWKKFVLQIFWRSEIGINNIYKEKSKKTKVFVSKFVSVLNLNQKKRLFKLRR